MKFKQFIALIVMVVIAVPVLMGQAGSSNSGMTVEEAYLQESVEMVILNSARVSTVQQEKLEALEHIGEMTRQGDISNEVFAVLEYFSLEGTINQARERGRLVNEFPDVRREAARHLGNVRTVESELALIRVCETDPEPLVLQQAIISLGNIGINEDNNAVNAIVRVTTRFNSHRAPDNLIALAAVDALDKIFQNSGTLNFGALNLLLMIAEGPYATAVKERAREVIISMRRSAAQGR
ncbi:MAG: HEAT repeat domain-containing protein [Treponema sp.]|nr:HEAT repeat domain-containing protein [Treponema sp.]